MLLLNNSAEAGVRLSGSSSTMSLSVPNTDTLQQCPLVVVSGENYKHMGLFKKENKKVAPKYKLHPWPIYAKKKKDA